MRVRINHIPNIRAFLDTGSLLTIVAAQLADRLRLRPDPNSAIKIQQLDSITRR